MLLYVYNIVASKVPGVDEWARHILLFCLDEGGDVLLLSVQHRPFLLLRGKMQPDGSYAEISTEAVTRLDNAKFRGRGGLELVETPMTPVYGFSNERVDRCHRLYYSQLGRKHTLLKHIAECGPGIGASIDDAEECTVLHQNLKDAAGKRISVGISDEELFRHVSGLRSHMWMEFTPSRGVERVRSMSRVSEHVSEMFLNVCVETDLVMCPDVVKPPPTTVMYISAEALSSTATVTNAFRASFALPEDCLRTIALRFQRLDGSRPVEDVLLREETDEKSMRARFEDLMAKHNPTLIVHSSCEFNQIEYLCHRFPGCLNAIKGVEDLPTYMEEDVLEGNVVRKKKRLFELPHIGRDCMDTMLVLMKFQTYPPMKGFSLQDAFEHEEIVKAAKENRGLRLDDHLRITWMSSPQNVCTRLKQEVEMLFEMVSINGFVETNATISRQCDISFTRACPGTVEVRTRNTWRRAFHREKLYMNHEQLQRRYVVVKRPRESSSYPYPEQRPDITIDDIMHRKKQRKNDAEESKTFTFQSALALGAKRKAQGSAADTLFALWSNAVPEGSPGASFNLKAAHRLAERDAVIGNLFGRNVPVNPQHLQPDAYVALHGRHAWDRAMAGRVRSEDLAAAGTVETAQKKVCRTATDKEFTGGLVLEPLCGFHTHPRCAVSVLDFSSLYPSVIVGYIVCYMRIVYDLCFLTDPLAELEFVPINDDECIVCMKSYGGKKARTIIPQEMATIMESRTALKRRMKAAKADNEKAVFNSRQLTEKVRANGAYGFFGSKTSGMDCSAIAAMVCALAAWMNLTVIAKVRENDGLVVYGDTDSDYIMWRLSAELQTRAEILRAVMDRTLWFNTNVLGTIFPKPNGMVFETGKLPLLLPGVPGEEGKKKLHLSLAYSEGGVGNFFSTKPPVLEIKGPAFKKRDRCPFVHRVGYMVTELVLHERSRQQIFEAFRDVVMAFDPRTESIEDLEDFVITCALGDKYKSDHLALEESRVLARHLAAKMQEETGMMPVPGRRLRYVIPRREDGALKCVAALTPTGFLRSGAKLDKPHYLMKQLMPPLCQILAHDPALSRRMMACAQSRADYLEMLHSGQKFFVKQ